MAIPGLVGGAEVSVIGLGKSGVAAARLLRAMDVRVYGSDGGSSERLDAAARELRALGAAIDVGRHDLGRIGANRVAVLSPGVPPDAPPVTAARAGGATIWAEAELGLRALGGRIPYVAVTGTNGKTTTTTLVGHLLTVAGKRCRTAGNIGTPLSEIALAADQPEVLAVELSSFQLHDLPSIRPAVGVLTNLAPDHLDRYPNVEAYYEDKMRLFANAGPESTWVTNADNPLSEQWVRAVGRRQRFSTESRADGWLDRSRNVLRLGGEALLERSRFPLLGDHNVANALAAAVAVSALGVPSLTIGAGLATMTALGHRMEPIREVGGVLWINDSKATNVSSTEVAILAMDRPFVLLLGGRHKGEPYRRLGPLLGRCRAVIAFGEARPIVVADLAGQAPIEEAGDFADVLARAARLAQPGDAVLLSPACSSYDMFANYEERGARFRAAVEAL